MVKRFFVFLMIALLVVPSLLGGAREKRWFMSSSFNISQLPAYEGSYSWSSDDPYYDTQFAIFEEQEKAVTVGGTMTLGYMMKPSLELFFNFSYSTGNTTVKTDLMASNWDYIITAGIDSVTQAVRFSTVSFGLGANFYAFPAKTMRPYFGAMAGVRLVEMIEPDMLFYICSLEYDSWYDEWFYDVWVMDELCTIERTNWATFLLSGEAGLSFWLGKLKKTIIYVGCAFDLSSVKYKQFGDATSEITNLPTGGLRFIVGAKQRF